ncbi:hypothetical protein HOP60_02835 [Halomonas daqingensis]|uniref:Lipoprotein n=1 Tax=Billgrantia desiderata TaxID=52021 RepID=A0ABS9B1W2_9GAMM|nr:hypothetical protein [Halomonas desiderata]MCE8041086.1 hypothetical protein [Halomonas desiderata]MCE8045661.1 hypothetical protein [Halomonas desiderata]
MAPRRLTLALTIATAALVLSGCPSPGDGEPPPAAETADTSQPEAALAPLEVGDEEIRAADGAVLLSMEDVPGTIRADQQAEFGAAERFQEASVSPDGAWLAVITAGAAHSAGWLVRMEARQPRPAAFQYGGNITIGPWSDDSRLVVFVQEGPAGGRTLTVVDAERLGETVEESAMPVRSPEHDELAPEERIYEALAWRNGELLFRVGGERWIFDPDSGEVRSSQ